MIWASGSALGRLYKFGRGEIRTRIERHPTLFVPVQRMFAPRSVESRVLVAVVRNGDVVFDVGANIGSLTLRFANLVGSGGEVHAFEPVPATFAVLEQTVAARRPRARVLLINVACDSRAGHGRMLVPEATPGQARLADVGLAAAPAHGIAVTTITLDRYVADAGIRRLDFLKADVEGAELPVLRGASNALQRWQPALYLETAADYAARYGYHPTDLIAFLSALGYDRFYRVADGLTLFSAKDAGAQSFTPYTNLLCLVSARHEQRSQMLARA